MSDDPTRFEPTRFQLSVTVDVPVEHAFRIFVDRFDEVKPHEHSLLDVPVAKTVFDPQVGGTVRDIGEDGSVCTWGRVLAYDPPRRVVFSWDITPQWQLETDLARTSEVEVRFTAVGPERTRVVLEHRHLDRHGNGWESFRNLRTGNGWPLWLERFTIATEHVETEQVETAQA